MITIFTPTYNRSHLLRILFKSLIIQSCFDFEWLIVDDGSTDQTEEIVKSFNSEGKFLIRYYKQINSGKHIAINYGVELANGDKFFIVDSDDWLLKDSIKIIYDIWNELLERGDYAKIAGIACARVFSNGKLNTSLINPEVIYGSIYKIRYENNILGDMAEVYKTSVLRKYPFPKIDDEKFCSESLIWNRIGEKYILRFCNVPIYCGDYLEGGSTDKSISLRANNPKYSSLVYQELINSNHSSFKIKIKAAINYWRFTAFDRSKSFIAKCSSVKFWSIAFFPIGIAFYVRDKTVYLKST